MLVESLGERSEEIICLFEENKTARSSRDYRSLARDRRSEIALLARIFKGLFIHKWVRVPRNKTITSVEDLRAAAFEISLNYFRIVDTKLVSKEITQKEAGVLVHYIETLAEKCVGKSSSFLGLN